MGYGGIVQLFVTHDNVLTSLVSVIMQSVNGHGPLVLSSKIVEIAVVCGRKYHCCKNILTEATLLEFTRYAV